ncbi:arsenic resistance protein [Salinicoccus halodurans]|uniref:Arsenic resistance protein n=1 Tax=Salinicoccus halodurans TaxID=407035 RepID=A0A0F7HLM7_9STAP|nr:bile acid:sodium symporter [Salinicoccus halodurans]AKG74509.1 arsenic resistance protein [Salinicoccus halodurans]SFK90557.1 Arsenite efflux pump ArsB, ACR3 family [Salinicoccus halodurans]
MNALEKYQPFIIMAAVVTGLVIGGISGIQMYAGVFIVPFLTVMLFGLFIMMPTGSIIMSFRKTGFFWTSLIINFIWTPLFAYSLGMMFLSDYPMLWIGFLMLMVTPCTDWYLVFTESAKGNTALSTSLLPVNLVVQVILLPVYLYLFFGTYETVGFENILGSILLVLVVPMILAAAVRMLFSGRRRDILEKKISPFFGRYNIIFLALAVMAMFASERDVLTGNPGVVLLMFLPVLLFFLVTFFISSLAGRLMKFNRADSISLIMTSMARNSPIALAIAVTAFADEPLIALALVIGPLIELPVLALTSNILLRTGEK